MHTHYGNLPGSYVSNIAGELVVGRIIEALASEIGVVRYGTGLAVSFGLDPLSLRGREFITDLMRSGPNCLSCEVVST